MDFFPFFVLGVAFIALVVWLIAKQKQSDRARARKLTESGFIECPEEADGLAEKITRLENNSEYTFSVAHPMRASLNGQTVYYYLKSRSRQGNIIEVSEFLVPLKRRSTAGLMLFIKPSELLSSTAEKLIGAMATGAWDSQPDDLEKTEIPIDLQGGNLIGALAPKGYTLRDTIDSQALEILQGIGDGGALIAMCRDEMCSLTAVSARMPLDLDQLLPLIRRLIEGYLDLPDPDDTSGL